jgi:hypothetical protein
MGQCALAGAGKQRVVISRPSERWLHRKAFMDDRLGLILAAVLGIEIPLGAALIMLLF